MKTMKTYYIPETEVVEYVSAGVMNPTSVGSKEDNPIPGGVVDAPGRHVGSLGPSY